MRTGNGCGGYSRTASEQKSIPSPTTTPVPCCRSIPVVWTLGKLLLHPALVLSAESLSHKEDMGPWVAESWGTELPVCFPVFQKDCALSPRESEIQLTLWKFPC